MMYTVTKIMQLDVKFEALFTELIDRLGKKFDENIAVYL